MGEKDRTEKEPHCKGQEHQEPDDIESSRFFGEMPKGTKSVKLVEFMTQSFKWSSSLKSLSIRVHLGTAKDQ